MRRDETDSKRARQAAEENARKLPQVGNGAKDEPGSDPAALSELSWPLSGAEDV